MQLHCALFNILKPSLLEPSSNSSINYLHILRVHCHIYTRSEKSRRDMGKMSDYTNSTRFPAPKPANPYRQRNNNVNFEIRISKSYCENSKRPLPRGAWFCFENSVFGHSTLFRLSDFVLRISALTAGCDQVQNKPHEARSSFQTAPVPIIGKICKLLEGGYPR